jgi:hypothetical protein
VVDAKGIERYIIYGRWNDKIYLKSMEKGAIEELVWEINPKIENNERQHKFDSFSVNLNYVDEEMKKVLPPTDSRLR